MKYLSGVGLWRGVSIVFVVLAVLAPKIRWPHSTVDDSVAVVFDTSASMGEKEGPLGETRFVLARTVWEDVRRSNPRVSVRPYVLGADLQAVEESSLITLTPSENACALNALNGVMSSSSTRAILLFSDGRSSDVEVAAVGLPVFAVGVGALGDVPDVSVDSVEAPPLTYAGSPVEVSAHLSVAGTGPGRVRVALFEKGKRRAETTVEFSSGKATASLTFTPSSAGLARCEVRAEPVSGETRTANNGRKFSLEVMRGRVRTLYIAGRPGPHYHFLRAQLKNDPAVELVSFVVLRDPEDVLATADSELSLIPFPTSLELAAQLPTFDVVALEEISTIRFGLGVVFFSALEKWVQSGGGFLSIQEPDVRFEDDKTALFRLSPWAGGAPAWGPERFRLKWVELNHPLISLTEGEGVADRGAPLATLEGSGRFFPGVKAGARVLAVDPVGGSPVLAERPFGRGRVLGLANTTSWRWALDGGRRGEGPADYQRFWENAVRWLAGSSGAGSLRLVRPGGALVPHEMATVRLRAARALARPPRMWAVSPNGKRALLSVQATDRTGEYAAAFTPDAAGFYEIRAQAGESERDSVWVEVSSPWDETIDTRPDFERLKVLAQKSGGRFVEAGHLDANALRRWMVAQRGKTRSGGTGTEIFFVSLALCALAGEWVFRRGRGVA
ncbi:MAG: hypothetical protein IPN90_12215 [Elusimicrobia bacterium]|nr:hypothetical protein [Elusimicrobiota bacterium]